MGKRYSVTADPSSLRLWIPLPPAFLTAVGEYRTLPGEDSLDDDGAGPKAYASVVHAPLNTITTIAAIAATEAIDGAET